MKTSQLEIPSLLRSDEGVYNCSVTNVANRAMRNGMDTKSVRLEVRGKHANLLKVNYLTFDLFLLFLSHVVVWIHLAQRYLHHVSCTLTELRLNFILNHF